MGKQPLDFLGFITGDIWVSLAVHSTWQTCPCLPEETVLSS